MIKTKTKQFSRFYFQQIFWLSLVIIFSWGLVVVRTEPLGEDKTSPSSDTSLPINDSKASDQTKNKQSKEKPSAKTSEPSANSPLVKQASSNPFRKDAAKIVNDQIITKLGKTYPLRTYEPMELPNDPLASQWWVSPTAMENAWSMPVGAKPIKIAVIDTGFALGHEEFAGRWATNEAESGPNSTNGIDDDSNGLVDDWRGWDFSNFDNSPQAGETNPDGTGTKHGTETAGVLGASGNNNAGIAGVNWHAKILPLQALNDDSYGNTLTVSDSIYYAVDQGVDIISISLGTDFEDPYLREAVLYAMAHDVIVVAAAGNDGCNCMVYPANYPEVVAVGASNSSNNPASFSSYGSELDIIAPGQNMSAPYWTKTNGSSGYVAGIAGTSFSTPFVSGVLGLMRAHQPDATWDEITGTLFENSDRRSLNANSPHNSSIGFGFVNVDSALRRASEEFQPDIIYQLSGTILGTERIKACDKNKLPGSFIYELTKDSQIRYTINQYQRRLAVSSGWTASKLFGTCVGLPTDIPDIFRTISLSQEIRDMALKQQQVLQKIIHIDSANNILAVFNQENIR